MVHYSIIYYKIIRTYNNICTHNKKIYIKKPEKNTSRYFEDFTTST